MLHGATTIDAHRSARAGLVDVHTHAIDADLPDLRQAYPHDRRPMRWTLADPDIPAEAKDPANWSAPMRAEWGTDSAVASAAHHRKLLVEQKMEGSPR